ncbi:MAG: DUF1569 domain-containing protein [Bacteroidetes bacterium]|nr:MAG: DUF1569 domain-containing protein [Bacteroidota bacterium]
MKSLFEEAAFEEILSRLEKLDDGLQPQWGKMSVGQMAWHCQIPLKVGISNRPPKRKSNPLIRLLFRKGMYSDRPWRKNLPTTPFAKAREPKKLSEELPILKQRVREFHALSDREHWNPHPIFGEFTHEQWGQMQYKHLDHHLTQFGV